MSYNLRPIGSLLRLKPSPAPAGTQPQRPVLPPLPTPSPAAPAPKKVDGTYTVKLGDSLYSIARKELNDGARWQEIYAMNPHQLPNPNKLVPGMLLKMPPLDPTGGAKAPTHPFFNDDDY